MTRKAEPQSYEDFRLLATDTLLESELVIGFAPEYRRGYEVAIADHIFTIFENFGIDQTELNPCLLDIGCGAGRLTDGITLRCSKLGLKHLLVDSPSMLERNAQSIDRIVVRGEFPQNLELIKKYASSPSLILSYSVAQYALKAGTWNDFVEGITSLMRPGSVALLGDIPNRDLRNRALMAKSMPARDFDVSSEFGDTLIIKTLIMLREKGFSAYLCPQPRRLPMSSHREDLIIHSAPRL